MHIANYKEPTRIFPMNINQTLLFQFENHWKTNHFPAQGNPLLITVSGGKDSMALLHLAIQLNFNIQVAHCNFQLRGEESDADEQLIVTFCKNNNITYHVKHFDTKAFMEQEKIGVQDAARKLRYEWFNTLMQQYKLHAILTAHHANDNAETLLANLLKGTGISGLHGIPVKNNQIIRPLLFANRLAIDQYIEFHQIPFREDQSNSSLKYLRNQIRHTIIPNLETIFPNAVETLNENIKRFNAAEMIYTSAMEKILKKIKEKRGNEEYLFLKKIEQLPYKDAIYYEVFSKLGFTSQQIPHIQALSKAETGKLISNTEYTVLKHRDFLIVSKNISSNNTLIVINESEANVITSSFELKIERIGAIDVKQLPVNNTSEIWLDAAKIIFPLILRKRKVGDYFYPFGMGMKKKKVSKFLSDIKLNAKQKENIWILEQQSKIIWLINHRIDERFKVTEATKSIVKIVVRPFNK
jgi:tRNA(Ile)-lysidine synthase